MCVSKGSFHLFPNPRCLFILAAAITDIASAQHKHQQSKEEMPIDYSKWDHFNDDEDDSSHDDGDIGPVRVTRLDEPSTVKIGADRSIEILQGGGEVETAAIRQKQLKTLLCSSSSDTGKVKADSPSSGGPQQFTPAWYESHHGAFHVSQNYGWYQDRQTVTLHVFRPLATVHKQIYTVELFHASPDRYSAGSSMEKKKTRLLVTVTTSNDKDDVIIDSDLHSALYIPEDHEGAVDWTIETVPHVGNEERRVLIIVLYKATPTALVSTVGWTQCLSAYESDLPRVTPPPTSNKNASQQQKAWEEAHAEFRKRIKEQQQQN